MLNLLLPLFSAKKVVIPFGVVAVIALSFTPTEITAITIAVGALLTTIFTGIVNILTVLRAERKVEHNTKITADTLAETKVIAGHVNSAATASKTQIEALQNELKALRSEAAEKREVAALLAQAAATAGASDVQPPIIVAHPITAPHTTAVPDATQHLKKIEKNTKDTVKAVEATAKTVDATAAAVDAAATDKEQK